VPSVIPPNATPEGSSITSASSNNQAIISSLRKTINHLKSISCEAFNHLRGGHLAAAAAFFHGVCTGNRYIGGFKPYRPTSKLAHTVHSRLRVRAQPTTCTVQCTQLLLLLCRYPPTQKFKFKTYAHQTLCKKTPPHTRGFFSNRSHQRPAVGWGGFDVRQCRVLSILLSIMAFPATTNG